MRIFKAQGLDAATLMALLEEVKAAGEEPAIITEAGDSWVITTKKAPGRPKAQER